MPRSGPTAAGVHTGATRRHAQQRYRPGAELARSAVDDERCGEPTPAREPDGRRGNSFVDVGHTTGAVRFPSAGGRSRPWPASLPCWAGRCFATGGRRDRDLSDSPDSTRPGEPPWCVVAPNLSPRRHCIGAGRGSRLVLCPGGHPGGVTRVRAPPVTPVNRAEGVPRAGMPRYADRSPRLPPARSGARRGRRPRLGVVRPGRTQHAAPARRRGRGPRRCGSVVAHVHSPPHWRRAPLHMIARSGPLCSTTTRME
jgi:hypothetical protein